MSRGGFGDVIACAIATILTLVGIVMLIVGLAALVRDPTPGQPAPTTAAATLPVDR